MLPVSGQSFMLTHISLESFCGTSATVQNQIRVWSGSPLFAYKIWIKMKNTTQQP